MQRLVAARNALDAMELRLTPEHPDVVRMVGLIRRLEADAEAEALETPLSGAPVQPARTPAESARANRMRQLRAELSGLDLRIDRMEADEVELRQRVALYQQRVEAAPTRESELIELTRDYSTLQNSYTSLLSKKEDSQIAANLERRQIGEQFKVLDPARVPAAPFSPNRARFQLLGALLGLGLGAGLAALLEYRDTSPKTDQDIADAIGIPVLAMLPIVTGPEELARTKRLRLLVAVSAVVLFALGSGGAALAWKMGMLDRWIG